MKKNFDNPKIQIITLDDEHIIVCSAPPVTKTAGINSYGGTLSNFGDGDGEKYGG